MTNGEFAQIMLAGYIVVVFSILASICWDWYKMRNGEYDYVPAVSTGERLTVWFILFVLPAVVGICIGYVKC